jgi:hypothetical protein
MQWHSNSADNKRCTQALSLSAHCWYKTAKTQFTQTSAAAAAAAAAAPFCNMHLALLGSVSPSPPQVLFK